METEVTMTHMKVSEMIRQTKGAIYLLIKQYYGPNSYAGMAEEDIEQVWFCYTNGNWKALFTTSIGDHFYYEVTFDKNVNRCYIDMYKKELQTEVTLGDPYLTPFHVNDNMDIPDHGYAVRPTNTYAGLSSEKYETKLDEFLKDDLDG